MKKEIYLDNAAATPIDPQVVRAMNRAAREPGNASALHRTGQRAAVLLADARETVAKFLNARPGEIVFCASGSEANTLALAGFRNILTQPTEHISVLRSAGPRARFLSVDSDGRVRPEELSRVLNTKTQVVSVMYANNEIGTIQPVAEIGRIIRDWRRAHRSVYPLFHVDACQASAYLDMDVQRLGADLLTLNGSKVYGPRGAAVLYVRRGVELRPQVVGGEQEEGRRAGTENIPAITGLAKALKLVKRSDARRVAAVRDYILKRLPAVAPDVRVNGPMGAQRLANNINISVPGADSEGLLLELDRRGVSAAGGSACTAHALEPSHVLKAVHTPRKYLTGALRFSLSRHTTRAEADRLLRILPGVIARARKRYLK